ncbi:MAG: hypothetical protein B1H11_02135 [Desulfobacteraceae bacterium 4484_190.1]|nr:MAG: hypothetical protein B1H11_02135 [Desulfobacteraceae bacterium 4484_190.1]
MAKKTLVFIVMVVVSFVVILSLAGWSRTNEKSESEKKKVRMPIPQKLQEVRIVAVEEKILPRTQKRNERKGGQPKKKETSVAKTKKPVKRNATRKKVSMVRAVIKKSENKHLKPKRLFPASFRLNHHMIDVGRELIDNKSSVPIVQASYDRIGFDSYLKKMRDMGGRLFVGDAKEQKILGEAIVGDHYGRYSFFGLDEGKKDDLDGMALFRPREISGERLVNEILNYAWQFFKDSDLRCVVLLPLDKEAAILGALKEYLNNSGYHLSQFDIVWGHYFQAGLEFGLKVEKARVSKTRETIHLDMILTM